MKLKQKTKFKLEYHSQSLNQVFSHGKMQISAPSLDIYALRSVTNLDLKTLT